MPFLRHQQADIVRILFNTSRSRFTNFYYTPFLLHSTMRMAKLDHYFPSASVRSLQKTKFELPAGKVLSEEDKLLHDKVVEFKIADQKSRLTSENYHTMMKLMLQMEDETESTKCLAYDQTDQAITHVRGNVYSLKIVSVVIDDTSRYR